MTPKEAQSEALILKKKTTKVGKGNAHDKKKLRAHVYPLILRLFYTKLQKVLRRKSFFGIVDKVVPASFT